MKIVLYLLVCITFVLLMDTSYKAGVLSQPKIVDSKKLSKNREEVYKVLRSNIPSSLHLDVLPLAINKDTVIYVSLLSKINWNIEKTMGQKNYLDTTYYKIIGNDINKLETYGKRVSFYLSDYDYIRLHSWYEL